MDNRDTIWNTANYTTTFSRISLYKNSYSTPSATAPLYWLYGSYKGIWWSIMRLMLNAPAGIILRLNRVSLTHVCLRPTQECPPKDWHEKGAWGFRITFPQSGQGFLGIPVWQSQVFLSPILNNDLLNLASGGCNITELLSQDTNLSCEYLRYRNISFSMCINWVRLAMRPPTLHWSMSVINMNEISNCVVCKGRVWYYFLKWSYFDTYLSFKPTWDCNKDQK